ncbi:ATP-binding cassette domain-containing protein [Lactobacillus delbrueckii]|uniref:ABC transporter domain-containing protein n=1 Tax=Lactobacillus delbrueckii subsp. bulgaricus TaxID=1585 RepID=A0AAV5PFS4_LACDE|nr:hypothetical protein [Lactobacillus delbrueckii subsp. bulgaricus]OAL42471.1 ABC transporter ATP binding protein [Lactobacillus delbrueckii subsp. bulgaricus]GMB83863.1 hypothetical protein ME0899_00870 [Lactobacillus delbrueckii subsp. bulgaricus]GMB87113.1 hypothetical protein ME0900_14860 [Lactobacillus delbrueckii subsp. bulgaricus]GMB88450.1 hypothetical protein ME0901_09720 [Lactobacillus delbrueckii subsp. bulgaricus]
MTAIQITHLSYTYPSQAEAIFIDLSLDLDSSWKMALVGRNGRGKTTFLRLLAGQCPEGREQPPRQRENEA